MPFSLSVKTVDAAFPVILRSRVSPHLAYVLAKITWNKCVTALNLFLLSVKWESSHCTGQF